MHFGVEKKEGKRHFLYREHVKRQPPEVSLNNQITREDEEVSVIKINSAE